MAQDVPAATKPLSVVTNLVTGLLSAVGLNSPATNGPTAPLQPSTLTGVLGMLSREIEYTLFNHKPKMSSDSALNNADRGRADHRRTATARTPTGTPSPTPSSRDPRAAASPSDPTAPSPTRRTRVWRPRVAQTPSPSRQAILPGNPFHIHGFALLSGLGHRRGDGPGDTDDRGQPVGHQGSDRRREAGHPDRQLADREIGEGGAEAGVAGCRREELRTRRRSRRGESGRTRSGGRRVRAAGRVGTAAAQSQRSACAATGHAAAHLVRRDLRRRPHPL